MDSRFEEHLEQVGFNTLTPIQLAVADDLVTGQSIDALAPTGTGKTLAFTWPILPKIVPGDGEQLLVLAPSQELAMQTTRVMREWASILGLKVLAVTGGANVKRQIDSLKKHPEVLVGTPGRVHELVANGKLKLQRLRTLIVDEADVLLREETADQITDIWQSIADSEIQVALFGATELDAGKAETIFERVFKRIDQRDVTIPVTITHTFMPTANDQKNKRLRQLASRKNFQAIVFFNTTKALKTTASFLAHEHVAMATLVRGDSSSTRATALANFRNGKAKFLLTTDVAARGLDIQDLPAVLNFDVARDGETYTHRAGRTGRMGHQGVVVTFGNDHDLRDLKRQIQVDIQVITLSELLGQVGPAEQSQNASKERHSKAINQKQATDVKQSVKSEKTLSRQKTSVHSKPTLKGHVSPKKDDDEISPRQARLAKQKKAKRRHQKDKGKPRRKE
ncbi:DEAD/DEAH box helicase [Weissella diestrammenae]|uniref:DEAD/DEAH box helicase n=1 Tax=Weissella diestrammenae TaxID=1162633 RepID=A0A7G9T4B1_9LACO|nr:DEAD/DEAH box helicase [Weissella diestrammenae]MCM0583468.1 DEAD/DEAH box helicase [Weissella diestrammenae]QNN74936.1 DEAD/DEAH box helicase [Weissella diestrammenae]